MDNIRKDTVAKLLESDSLGPRERRLLELRQQSAKTSTAKYEPLTVATCDDGRLRGTTRYCGASRTGRWGGVQFQPQNLPRGAVKSDTAVDAFLAGVADLAYDNVMEAASAAVRGMIAAPRDQVLAVVDYANIEGRVLAWLAGEEWKLDAFRAYDNGTGPDLYVLAYSRSFNAPVDRVSKADRQVGKVQELALGYGGGVNAFHTMAAAYGVTVSDERAEEIKVGWRRANPRIEALWYATERAVRQAIEHPGPSYVIAKSVRTQVAKRGALTYLTISLPSGRVMFYANPRFDGEDNIRYDGTWQGNWCALQTWGGKLVENIVQAIARDLLADALVKLVNQVPVVGHVHDEIIAVVDGADQYELIASTMRNGPAWSGDLPLAVDGYIAKRYRKG